LLAFSRRQPLYPRVFCINESIARMEKMLQRVIGEHFKVHTSLSAKSGRVKADPSQVEQVLLNLCVNARDAMPDGGAVAITSSDVTYVLDDDQPVVNDMPAGEYVKLTVSDTGTGIAPDVLKHIFEPFFTTKEKGKGTGLGLSTVHRIVKESGGKIWVHSTPGQGATFTICLPRAVQSADAGDLSTAPKVASAGCETLLLVEDEEGVRKLLMHVLHKRGYEVLEASNGEDALRIYERRGSDIQLVLTEMVMPRMSGRELGEKLRELRPDLKIIYMSGYTDDVLVRTGALGPGMSFLQKPLRPEVLAAKVREALDGKARR